jgi:DNA helicase-2/ATP-dependent DNA helicase PcrA
MSPELDLFAVDCGSITAPAGCGKTHLIASTLGLHDGPKPILILTHTNAGVAALKARLKRADVPNSAYRVSTIDSWCIRLISKFPLRSGHDPKVIRLENPGSDYAAVRKSACGLLQSGDVSDALRATYRRLLVDEYQDCSLLQHAIICWAATVLPTCVLGDPLQAIFDFREPTVDWQTNVIAQFPSIGELQTPWRWRNAGAEALGQWVLTVRNAFLSGQTLDLREAPSEVSWVQLDADPAKARTQRLEAARTKAPTTRGTVLVIGDSTKPQSQRIIASQTPGATTVEASDLKDLTAFGRSFNPASPDASEVLITFAGEMMTNLGATELHRRVIILDKGTARKEATPIESAALAFHTSPSFTTAASAFEVFAEAPNVRVYRPEVLQVCLTAMRSAVSGECTFYEGLVRARERNRHLGRPTSKRAIGSTLLLKGLEADVVVVLNPDVMNRKDLYVALTRGAMRVVVCSQSPVLDPSH